MSSVTTIIVTRNNCGTLLNTLAHVAPPVIVVDNASTDGSTERVRESFPRATVLRLPGDAGVTAYNFGARIARTRYVAFSDDRSWWERGAIARAAETLDEHPSIGLLGASSRSASGGHPDWLSRALGQSRLHGAGDLPGVPTLGFVDCFCVVRRQPFLDQGGFDALSGFGGMEQRLALDLASAGWAIRFRPDLVVLRGPRSLIASGRRICDDIITGVMRRPFLVAVRRAVEYLDWNPVGWLGLGRALVRLPCALRQRRRVSSRIEIRARMAQVSRSRRASYAQ